MCAARHLPGQSAVAGSVGPCVEKAGAAYLRRQQRAKEDGKGRENGGRVRWRARRVGVRTDAKGNIGARGRRVGMDKRRMGSGGAVAPPQACGGTAVRTIGALDLVAHLRTQRVRRRGLDALDLVVHLRVELPQPVQVFFACVPVAAAVGLEESGDHVAEGVGVGFQ